MKVRINTYDGMFYPEVKFWYSDWKVLVLDKWSSTWRFFSFPMAVSCGYGKTSKEKALDLLESYIGAGQSVIACDIVKRKK